VTTTTYAEEAADASAETSANPTRPKLSPVVKRSAPYETAEIVLREIYPREERLIHYRDNFYQWIGNHYREVETGEIRSRLYAFLNGAIVLTQTGEPRPFCPDKPKVDKVMDALKARTRIDNGLQAPAWLADADPQLATEHEPADLLPCTNGLLDLKTGKMLDHTPSFLTMNAVDYAYDPEAKAPHWNQFLQEILPGDLEAQETLQEIFGYLLTPDTRQQKIFLLIGASRSGKGTIARVLKALLGGNPNVAGPTLADLRDHFGLQPLIDKRAAIVSDARLAGQSHELVERLLSISGEDAIAVPRKHKEHWHGTLGVRFLILSNELPSLTDASGVIASRCILIRLRQSFLGRENTGLTETLIGELPGILNWAIEGLRRLRQRQNFVQPASSAEMIELLEDVASPIRRFVKDCCEVGPEVGVARDVLYEKYDKWREENGHHRMSKTKFGQALMAAEPSLDVRRPGSRGNQIWWCNGIKLVGRQPPAQIGVKVVPLQSTVATAAAGAV
jgi:putative DNA primase/helicase